MSQIHLSDALIQQIETTAGLTGSAVDEFVQQAVREKLDWEARRQEFRRITSRVRQAMHDQGLTEEDILADFESFRREMSGQPGA
jgi:hypothetical protein